LNDSVEVLLGNRFRQRYLSSQIAGDHGRILRPSIERGMLLVDQSKHVRMQTVPKLVRRVAQHLLIRRWKVGHCGDRLVQGKGDVQKTIVDFIGLCRVHRALRPSLLKPGSIGTN
jgi:hypothetical protein